MAKLSLARQPACVVVANDNGNEVRAHVRLRQVASALGIGPCEPHRAANSNFQRAVQARVAPLQGVLRAAFKTLRLMPRDRNLWPAGVRSGWPDVLRDAQGYGYDKARRTPTTPTARQIQQMDNAFRALLLLAEYDRRAVMAVCNGASYRDLGELLGCSHEKARTTYIGALATLAVEISRRQLTI